MLFRIFWGIGLFGMLLGSCQSSTNTSTPHTEANLQTVALADTQPKQPIVYSTSRPTDQINSTFPYDIELKDAKGQITPSTTLLNNTEGPTVLMFWLTTCAPCRMEMKAIAAKYAQWQQEVPFQLIAISTDFPKRYEKFVQMVEENNWPWPSYHDHRREFRYVMPGRLNGLPQVFVMSSEGEVLYHKRKYLPGDEDKLFAAVKQYAKS